MLWKLGAAAVLFGTYFIAPLVMGGHTGDRKAAEGHKPSKKDKMMVVAMHVIAFSAGVPLIWALLLEDEVLKATASCYSSF